MTAAAQLDRIATVLGDDRPRLTVRIYQLAREWDFWTWLCPDCLEKRKAAGWQKREDKDPPHALKCDG